MATDPICGMTVDESSPLRAERDGQTFYFCSEHCRTKFVGQTESAKTVQPAPAVTFSAASHAPAPPFASRPRRGGGKTHGRGKVLLPDVSGRGVG